MSNKRVPLSSIPNAINSPYRAVAAAASKRSRDQIEAQEDLSYDVLPRAKRPALQDFRTTRRSPTKKQLPHSPEDKVFNKRPSNALPTAFERKLLAAKEEQAQNRVERQQKASHDATEGVRQWQKYYKKSFPTFVFYFESVPEDNRLKCSRYVKSLGAREEKFFSKEVTHVITTRPIPADNELKEATDTYIPPSLSSGSQIISQPKTINPSLLDRQLDSQAQPLQQPRDKFSFEARAGKRIFLNGARDAEPRKGNSGNGDILHKAKEMGIKVWQLEKLQRIMNTMFEAPHEVQLQISRATRARTANVDARPEPEADLSHMLRNERLNGPLDRDASIALNEMIPFKGYFIYVRDMDERTKPVMVRDYPKTIHNEDGEWPQFRSVSVGKCPFVEEVIQPSQQEHERTKAKEEELRAKVNADSRPARTRAATIRDDSQKELTKPALQAKPLAERKNGANASMPKTAEMPAPILCPRPPTVALKQASPSKVLRDATTNAGPKLFGGEPAASGMQPSNITSAIRSQMISSTAAAPGAKAGTSKEVHGLKRKVLEKNSGPALNGVQSRQRPVNPDGNGQAEETIPAARQTRRQAKERLVHIAEESTLSEEDEDVWMAEEVRKNKQHLRKGVEKKDRRPGYCENCLEKYEDFDTHILGRKHRKFALTQENWKDLDRLLAHLGRRLKDQDSDGF